jgi:hypothetical protein
MNIGLIKTYSLPVVKETSLTLTTSVMPTFISVTGFDFNFAPALINDLGLFKVEGYIANAYLQSKYSFIVKVINDPPYFDSNLKTSLTVYQNDFKVYNLPS